MNATIKGKIFENFWNGGPTLILVETWLQLTLSSLGIVSNLLSLQILFHPSFKIHFNVKILVASCSATYLYRSFHYALMCLYHFDQYYEQPQNVIVSSLICILVQYPYYLANISSYIYALMIGFERAWSTYKFKQQSRTAQTTEACPCHWKNLMILSATPLIVMSIFYLFCTNFDIIDQTIDYCSLGFTLAPIGYMISNIFLLIIQLSTCLAYGLVYWINTTKYAKLFANTALYSVSLRAKYLANVKITCWLTPVAIFHCILSFGVFFSFMIFRYWFPEIYANSYYQATRISFAILALECLTHPIMLISTSPMMIETCKQLWFGRFVRKTKLHNLFKCNNNAEQEANELNNQQPSLFTRRAQNQLQPVVDYRIGPDVNETK